MKIKLIHELAQVPTRGSDLAAGFDLHAVEACVIPPGTRAVIRTGICLELQDFYWAQIAPRSGLAVKHGIMTMAGVIDPDYRGEVKVVLYNSSDSYQNDFIINPGDRIAQLIIHRRYDFNREDFEVVSDLAESARGDGGFGSTGK